MTLQPAVMRIVALALTLGLGSCAQRQAEWAAAGKSALVGLSETDVRMCAGHPANTATVKDGAVWTYEQKAATPNGAPLLVPTLTLFSLVGGSDGYCRVQLRFVKGKVTEVSYAGATESWGQRDAVCGPMVRTCAERAAARH